MLRFLFVNCISIFVLMNFSARCELLKKNVTYNDRNKNISEISFFYDGRIVNGTTAKLGQFPYQVSLRRSYNNVHFCGGSIISKNVILTAAHCMFINKIVLIPPFTISVVAGELEYTSGNGNSNHQRNVKSITLHDNYTIGTYENDIALLHLNKPFIFDITLYPVELTLFAPFAGTVCQVAGWGRTVYNGTESEHLLYVDLPIIKRNQCKKTWSSLYESQFCAGYAEGGKDACQGDSGGGFVCHGLLAGIVSTGIGCAWKNKPGLYTNVAYFRTWIIDHLEYNEEERVMKENHSSHPSYVMNFAPSLMRNNIILLSSCLVYIIFQLKINFI